MREIKFRGIDNITKKFIYSNGYYFDKFNYWFLNPDSENHAIAYAESHIVLPETIGEFTGLKDKNGKDVYEGDKVKHEDGTIMTVCWNDKTAGFVVEYDYMGETISDYISLATNGIIIGNKFENKELLK